MKYLPLFTLLLFLGCEKSPLQIAKSAIERKAKNNLKYPETYESVEFTELYPKFRCEKIKNELEDAQRTLKLHLDLEYLYRDDIKYDREKLELLSEDYEKLKYDSTIVEYTIAHTYKCKNGFGVPSKNTAITVLDTNYTIKDIYYQ